MKSAEKKIVYCLSIAGFDPSGGAGLSADLRVFSSLGVVGMAAATALTPQNSGGVKLVEAVRPEILRSQLEAVYDDVKPSCAKTGQIPDIETAREIVRIMCREKTPLVVDPVAVPTRGRRIATEECAMYVKSELLPLCSITTPNAAEASWLSGIEVHDIRSAECAARRIAPAIAPALVITGIIDGSRICDLFFDGRDMFKFCRKLLDIGEVHGTGCHFSSALCAYAAMGYTLPVAVGKAGKRMQYWLLHRLLDPSGRMNIINS